MHRVNRLQGTQTKKAGDQCVVYHASDHDKLKIFDKKTYHFIPFDQILYCQAFNNYCSINVAETISRTTSYLVTQTLKSIEQQLPLDQFYRTHQSYLVNKYAIKSIVLGKQQVVELKNDKLIPISRRRRKKLIEKMM